MLRHGNELYVIARTDPDGTFMTERDLENPVLHHVIDLAAYSLRRHGTALWKLSKDGNLEHILDLPGKV